MPAGICAAAARRREGPRARSPGAGAAAAGTAARVAVAGGAAVRCIAGWKKDGGV
ncbi:MAG: hypothetical protein K0S16_296 [Moraxellaceae bacterium]|nr:hypothetical protein [Moraxellaceae bacterium]